MLGNSSHKIGCRTSCEQVVAKLVAIVLETRIACSVSCAGTRNHTAPCSLEHFNQVFGNPANIASPSWNAVVQNDAGSLPARSIGIETAVDVIPGDPERLCRALQQRVKQRVPDRTVGGETRGRREPQFQYVGQEPVTEVPRFASAATRLPIGRRMLATAIAWPRLNWIGVPQTWQTQNPALPIPLFTTASSPCRE